MSEADLGFTNEQREAQGLTAIARQASLSLE